MTNAEKGSRSSLESEVIGTCPFCEKAVTVSDEYALAEFEGRDRAVHFACEDEAWIAHLEREAEKDS